MLNIFDIAKNNNYFNFKEPTVLKYVIEGNKNTPNIRLISNQLGYKEEIGFTNIIQDGLFEIDL